jgi:hypothetical protein
LVDEFKKLSPLQQKVTLDVGKSLQTSFQSGMLPRTSPHRVSVLHMATQSSVHSSNFDQAQFFGVSERTIQRSHDKNVRTRKQLFTDKYKHHVTRIRVDEDAENEAREIVKSFLHVRSGRKFIVKGISDSDVYREYERLLPVSCSISYRFYVYSIGLFVFVIFVFRNFRSISGWTHKNI